MAKPDTVYVVPGTGTIMMEEVGGELEVTPHSLEAFQKVVTYVGDNIDPSVRFVCTPRPDRLKGLRDSGDTTVEHYAAMVEAMVECSREEDALAVIAGWGTTTANRLAAYARARKKQRGEWRSKGLANSHGIVVAKNTVYDAAGRFVPSLASAQEPLNNLAAALSFALRDDVAVEYVATNDGDILPWENLAKQGGPDPSRQFINKNRPPIGSYTPFFHGSDMFKTPRFRSFDPQRYALLPKRKEENRKNLYVDKSNNVSVYPLEIPSDNSIASQLEETLHSVQGVVIAGTESHDAGEIPRWLVDLLARTVIPNNYAPRLKATSALRAAVICSGSANGIVDPHYGIVSEGIDRGLWNAVDSPKAVAEQRLSYMLAQARTLVPFPDIEYLRLGEIFASGGVPEMVVSYGDRATAREIDQNDKERRQNTQAKMIGPKIPEDLLYLNDLKTAIDILQGGDYGESRA